MLLHEQQASENAGGHQVRRARCLACDFVLNRWYWKLRPRSQRQQRHVVRQEGRQYKLILCTSKFNRRRERTWIADHASVKDYLACDASLSAKRITFDYGAILQYQLCLWATRTQNIHCIKGASMSVVQLRVYMRNQDTLPAAQSMARDEVCCTNMLHQ